MDDDDENFLESNLIADDGILLSFPKFSSSDHEKRAPNIYDRRSYPNYDTLKFGDRHTNSSSSRYSAKSSYRNHDYGQFHTHSRYSNRTCSNWSQQRYMSNFNYEEDDYYGIKVDSSNTSGLENSTKRIKKRFNVQTRWLSPGVRATYLTIDNHRVNSDFEIIDVPGFAELSAFENLGNSNRGVDDTSNSIESKSSQEALTTTSSCFTGSSKYPEAAQLRSLRFFSHFNRRGFYCDDRKFNYKYDNRARQQNYDIKTFFDKTTSIGLPISQCKILEFGTQITMVIDSIITSLYDSNRMDELSHPRQQFTDARSAETLEAYTSDLEEIMPNLPNGNHGPAPQARILIPASYIYRGYCLCCKKNSKQPARWVGEEYEECPRPEHAESAETWKTCKAELLEKMLKVDAKLDYGEGAETGKTFTSEPEDQMHKVDAKLGLASQDGQPPRATPQKNQKEYSIKKSQINSENFVQLLGRLVGVTKLSTAMDSETGQVNYFRALTYLGYVYSLDSVAGELMVYFGHDLETTEDEDNDGLDETNFHIVDSENDIKKIKRQDNVSTSYSDLLCFNGFTSEDTFLIQVGHDNFAWSPEIGNNLLTAKTSIFNSKFNRCASKRDIDKEPSPNDIIKPLHRSQPNLSQKNSIPIQEQSMPQQHSRISQPGAQQWRNCRDTNQRNRNREYRLEGMSSNDMRLRRGSCEEFFERA